jgi:hypothetical protein
MIVERVGDDMHSMSSRQRYNIGIFYFYRSKRRLVDEIDRINRIDSHTIKRGPCTFA